MPSTITADKAALRASVNGVCLSDAQRAASDALLLERFLALPQLDDARSVLLYYGIGGEPDTSRLFEPLEARGKLIALPCCLPGGQMEARQYSGPGHLVSGPYGIPQPDETCPVVEPGTLSLILVPAVCCDKKGGRLGHGGGYYDRYLPRTRAVTVCLCRNVLLQQRVPTELHDVSMDMVLTETDCLSFFKA